MQISNPVSVHKARIIKNKALASTNRISRNTCIALTRLELDFNKLCRTIQNSNTNLPKDVPARTECIRVVLGDSVES